MATQLQEPVIVPDEVVADEQTPERDFDTEARAHGWKPQDEFQGDPAKWTDAETFVKRADEIMPLMREQNKDLRRKISEMERTVKKLAKSEQAAHKERLEALQTQRLEAFDSGDREAFVAADKKADELRKDMGDAAPALNGEDPAEELDTFREANPWFDKANLASASETDVEARLFADRTADKWVRQGLHNEIPPSEFYKRLAEAVNDKYPALKVRAIRPKPASDVTPNTRSVPRSGAKTGASLPPEAKETAERYVRLKLPGYAGKTAAEAHNLFAQSYFEQ
jgi:hypothetical protein